jgi:hypothetical protein
MIMIIIINNFNNNRSQKNVLRFPLGRAAGTNAMHDRSARSDNAYPPRGHGEVDRLVSTRAQYDLYEIDISKLFLNLIFILNKF